MFGFPFMYVIFVVEFPDTQNKGIHLSSVHLNINSIHLHILLILYR